MPRHGESAAPHHAAPNGGERPPAAGAFTGAFTGVLAVLVVGCGNGGTARTDAGPEDAVADEADAGGRCGWFYDRLDLTRSGLELVRAAVDAGQCGPADAALLAYMRMRREPVPADDGEGGPRAVTAAADAIFEGTPDGVLRGSFDLMDHTAEFPAEVDWTYVPAIDGRPLGDDAGAFWHAMFHRHYFLRSVARGYLATPDDSWGFRWKDLVESWCEWAEHLDVSAGMTELCAVDGLEAMCESTSPYGFPATAGYPDLADRTDAALRLVNWLETYPIVVDSGQITPAFHRRFLEAVYHHASWALAVEAGVWAEAPAERWTGRSLPVMGAGPLVRAAALVFAAWFLPEFRESAAWAADGLRVLELVSRETLADGVWGEQSTARQIEVEDALLRVVRFADANGLDAPAGVRETLGRLVDVHVHLATPGLRNVQLGAGPSVDQAAGLTLLADALGREDARWVATGGASGTAPEEPSRAFIRGGWVVQRSSFAGDGDARQLVFDAGPYGGCAGDLDVLGVRAFAYGEDVVRAGMRDIDCTARDPWEASAPAVVGADDTPEGYAAGSGDDPHAIDHGLYDVYSGRGFDFACGAHENHPGLRIERCVFYRRTDGEGDYWIVSDRFTGTTERALYRSPWILSPPVLLPELQLREAERSVVGRGVVVAAADDPRITVAVDRIPTAWAFEAPTEAPVAVISRPGPLPVANDAVLRPYRPEGSRWYEGAPHVEVRRLAVTTVTGAPVAAAEATALEVCAPGTCDASPARDTYLLSTPRIDGERIFGGYRFDGSAALVATDATGAVTEVQVLAGNVLAATEGPTGVLASITGTAAVVHARGDTVEIVGCGFTAFEVYAPAATRVFLNGTPLEFVREGDRVRNAEPIDGLCP